MVTQPDPAELKTFADWCHVKDTLPTPAKRTVEALLYQIEGHLWAYPENANEALWQEWQEWKLERKTKRFSDSNTQCNCELSNRILSTCHFLETKDWCGGSFQLTDLRPLTGLGQLLRLDLSGKIAGRDPENGRLSDLTPLTALTNLLTLTLHGNRIADLRPLSQLTGLVALDLSSNHITEIKPLSILIELSELDLAENYIRELSPLKTLKGLTSLNLANNDLTDATDLDPLMSLPRLTHLNLAHNQISDRTLEAIAELTTLQFLDISHNRITDISVLKTLPHLIELKYI